MSVNEGQKYIGEALDGTRKKENPEQIGAFPL
jgi:hypothetical protein